MNVKGNVKVIDDAKPTEVSVTKIINNRHNYELDMLTKKQRKQVIQPVRSTPKIGRNKLCPCGSNKKYKNCCI